MLLHSFCCTAEFTSKLYDGIIAAAAEFTSKLYDGIIAAAAVQ